MSGSDPERLTSRFELFADLLGQARVVRLRAPLDATPVALAALVEAAAR
jgi:hypothetical protein